MKGNVARIQEEIREARGGRTAGTWLVGIGLLFAISPLLIVLFTLIVALSADRSPEAAASGMEYFAFSLPVGLVVAVGGIVVAAYYDNKIKKLMQKLGQGGGDR